MRFLFAGVLCLLASAGAVAADPPAAATTPTPAPTPTPVWKTVPPPPAAPAPARTGKVSVAGADLYYAIYGEGAPVLLLHGGLGHGGYWSRQIPALTAAGFQAIALDSRGHGRSTRGDAPIGYARMTDDVVAVLDRLGIARASVVGWSDGGIIGLDLAIRHPQRLDRLLAFGANYRTDGIRLDVKEDPTGDAYGGIAHRDYLALSPTPAEFEAFVAALDTMWKREPDFSDAQLATIRAPTLIAAGAHEEYIRLDHTLALAQRIPGAELAILPGMSHFGLWQSPELFNRVMIDFLKH